MPVSAPEANARRTFWVLWGLLFVLKAALACVLPLFGDEAWYWLEGQHLAWAYSDLPGLTAWMIRAGVEVGGNSLAGVRSLFLLMAMAVPLLVLQTARRWFGSAVGWHAASLSLLLPLLGGLGFLALPDVPLTFAAALCLYAVARLSRGVDARGAALLALGLVLGALSHYRFVLLLAAGLAGMLLDPGARRALADRRVQLAVLIGALAWWPLVQWNLQHGGAGLAFQFEQRHPWQFHADGLMLLPMQLLVVTPLLSLAALLAVGTCWQRWRAGSEGPWGMILGMSAVPIVCYAFLGAFADSERTTFHWMLQAYLPLLAVLPLVLQRWSLLLRVLTHAFAAAGLLALLAYCAVAAWPAARAQLADSRWYPDNFAGWSEVQQAVRARLAAMGPETTVVADNFMLGAQLAFALQDSDVPILDHPLNRKHGRAVQLALWQASPQSPGPAPTPGNSRLLVLEDSAVPLRLRLDHYHDRCALRGPLLPEDVLSVDHGRKRFLLVQQDNQVPTPPCRAPALAWIDSPAAGATIGRRLELEGWAFKDGVGIERVEVTLDGVVVAQAEYGLPRPHVAGFWRISTDPAHPDVGFHATLRLDETAVGQHWLGLRLHGRDASIEDWPEQRLTVE